MKCVNKTTGKPVALEVKRADTFFTRLFGLLPRSGLGPQEGLLLSPCPQVHTFFMRFVMDAVFMDAEGRVLKVILRMKPWRVSPWISESRSVLEMAAGAVEGKVSEGDVLAFED